MICKKFSYVWREGEEPGCLMGKDGRENNRNHPDPSMLYFAYHYI